MKLRSLLCILMVVLLLFSMSNASIVLSAENTSSTNAQKIYCNATLEDDFVNDEVLIIVFPEWNGKQYVPSDFSEIGCTAIEEIFTPRQNETPSRIIKLQISNKSKEAVLAAVAALELRDDIYSAEPNIISSPATVPDDPKYEDDSQWAINKISLPTAWNITTGSSSVMVGIIDTGIYGDHPDLNDRVNRTLSKSFTSISNNALADVDGHGTHVAGIIGAEGNNSLGVVGVCWNVSLVSLRVENEEGSFPHDNVVAAINYAEAMNIPILNYSGGWFNYSEAMYTAISNYSGLFVTIAGNESTNNDQVNFYPANYELGNVIVVGNSTASDDLASSSGYGATTVDVFAPGSSIMSTLCSGGYGLMSGTSMAAPYVAGLAALVLSKYPSTTVAQLKAAIINHVDVVYNSDNISVFGNKCVSGGRINAYRSLSHTITRRAGASLETHECYCTKCEYVVQNEPHMWAAYNGKYRCSRCKMVSSVIPADPKIISGNLTLRSALNAGNSDFVILLEEGTYICCIHGDYYLVKAENYDEALTLVTQVQERENVKY